MLAELYHEIAGHSLVAKPNIIEKTLQFQGFLAFLQVSFEQAPARPNSSFGSILQENPRKIHFLVDKCLKATYNAKAIE